MKKITIFETFAGIGSQFYSLKKIANQKSIKCESLGFVEWYKSAIIAYQIIHNSNKKIFEKDTITKIEDIKKSLKSLTISNDSKQLVAANYFSRLNEDKLRLLFPYLKIFINSSKDKNKQYYTDIKQVETIPEGIDIFTYSFPCQDLSQQGLQRGLNETTRSGLLWEIKRILLNNQDKLPKILLMENVKNLTSKKFLGEFKKWINFLESLGYHNKWKVLNASDYGSAQNRERVFMVSWFGDKNFEWPKPKKHNNDLSKIININDTSSTNLWEKFKNYPIVSTTTSKLNIKRSKIDGYSTFNSENYLYYPTGFGPTLTASGANSRLKFLVKNEFIREINEYEAFEYMGFNKKNVDSIKASKLVSGRSIIFLSGNSICIEVLDALFVKIIELL